MTWWMILAAVAYGIGWLAYIFLNGPRDSFEGAMLIISGVGWPLFALGWLVSR